MNKDTLKELDALEAQISALQSGAVDGAENGFEEDRRTANAAGLADLEARRSALVESCEALTAEDQFYLKFTEDFENTFVNQGGRGRGE